MTSCHLIYRRGRTFRLIDPEYERLIGLYDFYEQAVGAWTAYISQGRRGSGLDISLDDEVVIDAWRKDSQQFSTSRCVIKRKM